MSHRDPQTTTITGHLTPADKSADDFVYLPFDVPQGTGRIDVEYDHTQTSSSESRAGEDNILDIAIFGPGSEAGEPREFRGGSGGARTGFFVSPQEATPGYLAGPLPSGRWHIMLGLYRIGSRGCDYTVKITLSGRQEPSPHRPPDRPRVARSDSPDRDPDELTWYIGDLQSHTHHSDGKASVAEIARVAGLRGLDFLAVTDHNTTSHLPELEAHSTEDLLLVPGTEVTTFYGHANVWGLNKWVDFRLRSSADLPSRIRAAHDQHALISINHPISDCPWTFGWVDGIDAIEVWQGLWNAGNNSAVAWWDELLSEGKRIVGVGGSDRHQPAAYDPYFPHQVGTPSTRVRAGGLSTAHILDGIRGGRVAIAATPDGPWLDMTVVRGDGTAAAIGEELAVVPGEEVTVECSVHGVSDGTLELISGGNAIARRAAAGVPERFQVRVGEEAVGYIRCQLIAGPVATSRAAVPYPRFLALTNPVYLKTPGWEQR